MTTNNLTELWKKGKLENGEYFILTNSIIEKMEYIKEHNGFGFDEIGWVNEVLAPVPSYEEWQKLKEFADYSIHNRNELTRQINYLFKENKKFKELLKRCRDFINYEVPDHCIDDVLLDKINEVLK